MLFQQHFGRRWCAGRLLQPISAWSIQGELDTYNYGYMGTLQPKGTFNAYGNDIRIWVCSRKTRAKWPGGVQF